MALPVLTAEQRAAAKAAKAAEARTARAAVFAALKAGEVTVADLFARAEIDGIVKNTKVFAVIKALLGFGVVRAGALVDSLSIARSRRIGGVGSKQRKELLAAVEPD